MLAEMSNLSFFQEKVTLFSTELCTINITQEIFSDNLFVSVDCIFLINYNGSIRFQFKLKVKYYEFVIRKIEKFIMICNRRINLCLYMQRNLSNKL